MDPQTRARLDQARAELRSTVSRARAALEEARQRLGPTREELDRLQDDARSGALGRDMQVLAERVADGSTTWPAVFDGTSPYKDLLRGHLSAMGEQHAEQVRARIEADPDVDPTEGSPGV